MWIPVAGGLARLGDRRAFEALLSKLADRDAGVRLAAIGALNSIGPPDMAGRVAAMLDDDNPLGRESAVRIAGYFCYAECAGRVLACEAGARAARHLPASRPARWPRSSARL